MLPRRGYVRLGRAGGDQNASNAGWGGGGGQLFTSASCADPCAAPIISLQRKLHSACSRCSARYCAARLANTVGAPETNLRVVARGTFLLRSHTRIS